VAKERAEASLPRPVTVIWVMTLYMGRPQHVSIAKNSVDPIHRVNRLAPVAKITKKIIIAKG
jgi:hypothetical protein